MKLDRTLILVGAAALIALVRHAQAAEPAPVQLAITSPQSQTLLVSQDPLTRQILQQLTKENGGVKAVVRTADGQSEELHVPEAPPQNFAGAALADASAIPVLTPLPELVRETKPQAPAKKKPAKKASDQLKTLQKQGPKQDWEAAKDSQPKAKQPAPVEPGLY